MRRRRGDDWHEWVDGYNRFYAMLKAEAYVDAAMMLIPAGWERDIVDADNGDCIAQLQTDDQQAWARAKTWGLAIAAAALRARSHTDGETSHV